MFFSMYLDIEAGLLYFMLAKSTNIVSAYKEATDIVMNYVSGKTPFSDVELESARSSLIFEIIEEEKTVSDVANQSLLSYFRGISQNYYKEFLQKVAKVTISDLQRVGSKYMAPLFDASKIKTSVCCHPSKVEEVAAGFKELGLELTVLSSLDEEFLCSY